MNDTLVYKENNLYYYKFKPRLFKLIPDSVANNKSESFGIYFASLLTRFIFSKYFFYYVLCERELAGYLIINTNYLNKYFFLKKDDFLVKPLYIKSKYRGNKLSEKLIQTMISDLSNERKTNIYAIVNTNNVASLKSFLRNGFTKNACISYKKAIVIYTCEDKNGSYELLKYKT